MMLSSWGNGGSVRSDLFLIFGAVGWWAGCSWMPVGLSFRQAALNPVPFLLVTGDGSICRCLQHVQVFIAYAGVYSVCMSLQHMQVHTVYAGIYSICAGVCSVCRWT